MLDMERKNPTTIFEAMVDGVYIVDDDFNVEHMNDVMIKNFGRDLEGKNIKLFVFVSGIITANCSGQVKTDTLLSGI